MKVRHYRAEDATAIAELYLRSVEQIGRRDYSDRQVAVWASHCPSPQSIDAMSRDGRTTLVAVDESDRPVAFTDLEADGHIHFLYCSPEVAGKGVASALLDALERIARERGMTRLHSEASEAARRFFLRKGFTVLSRRQLEISGVAIHNYAVEKMLATKSA